jgi:TRAP-type C4-dicarboxylate transport system substrate-binding protein
LEAKNGSFGFDFAGTYTKIVPLQLLQYAFGDRTALVEFISGAQGVTLKVTFDAETEHPLEQQQEGWQSILNHFRKHVESAA